jgi:hypothetical protein
MWVMWLKAIASSSDRRGGSRWRSDQPAKRRRPTPVPVAVPSSTRLDCGTQVWYGAGRRLCFEGTGQPPGLSHVRAALCSDPGRRASSCDPLERVAARMASADDLALSRRLREQRPLADEGGGPDLKRVREFADRRVDTDDLGQVWGERGGNEIPERWSYAGPR